jgi:hypothetical protein
MEDRIQRFRSKAEYELLEQMNLTQYLLILDLQEKLKASQEKLNHCEYLLNQKCYHIKVHKEDANI